MKIFGLICYAFLLNPGLSQSKEIFKTDSVNKPNNKNFAIGCIATSNGIGLQIAKPLGKKQNFALRLSASYLPYSFNNFVITIDGKSILLNGNTAGGFKLKVNGEIELSTVGIFVDYHPFNNAFKICIGSGLLYSNMNFIATPRDSLKQGDISIPPNEQGNIFLGLRTQLFCPYLGVGFGKAVPKKRIGLNIEIGTYYIGSPKLSFNTTGMLEPTSSEEKKLRNNIKNYYLLPALSLGINIRLGK